jgi:acyl-CoA thioester hydrolase
MGVVYYGNYFTWFEIGRVELCRQIGFEYKKMEIEDDSFLVVAEASCRYKRAARFDDLLTIRTRVTAAQRRTVRFAYEIIHQETGETIATGETTHVICNRLGRRSPCRKNIASICRWAATAREALPARLNMPLRTPLKIIVRIGNTDE